MVVNLILLVIGIWLLALIFWLWEIYGQSTVTQKPKLHRANTAQEIVYRIRRTTKIRQIPMEETRYKPASLTIPTGNDVFIKGGNGALVRAYKRYRPRLDKYQRWKGRR
jgi:hypothetical protein